MRWRRRWLGPDRRAVALALALLVVAGCALLRDRPPPMRDGVQTGIASWYGPGFHGRPTASGELYDQHALTAAHRTLPLGTRVEVENPATGQRVRVRINDRGPFVGARVIDLSYGAAQRIGLVGPGIARVRITVLEAPH